ncbi:MAG: hypothetical protein LBI58_06380 [Tannerellaceae bacterium]|nr:hypothetical protein [Tannerellaceae bacterium]
MRADTLSDYFRTSLATGNIQSRLTLLFPRRFYVTAGFYPYYLYLT